MENNLTQIDPQQPAAQQDPQVQDPPAQQQTPPPQKDELQVMGEQIQQMKVQLEEANSRLSDPGYIEYLARRAMGDANQQAHPGNAQTAQEPQLPEDFDSIKPAEFLKLIQDTVAQTVLPQVGQVAGSVSKLEARLEIERVAQKYEDFDQYVPVMQELVQQNPYLQPEQAYLLAKNVASKQAPAQEPAQVVSLAEKIAQELRGNSAPPSGQVPNREPTHRSPDKIASSVFDKIFGKSKD
jgi:hypothetical protein